MWTAARQAGRYRCRSASASGREVEVWRPLAERGERIHACAVGEGLLCRGDVLILAVPGEQRRGLEGAAIGESELPGQGAEPVHSREVRGRLFVRLAA